MTETKPREYGNQGGLGGNNHEGAGEKWIERGSHVGAGSWAGCWAVGLSEPSLDLCRLFCVLAKCCLQLLSVSALFLLCLCVNTCKLQVQLPDKWGKRLVLAT